MKHFLFLCLLSSMALVITKDNAFEPEVTNNIAQTAYWGVIVETLKKPIKDFLTHQNSNLLKSELQKSYPQLFVSPKEYVSIVTLLVLQPDVQKKLAIYSEAEKIKILKNLFAVVAMCIQENVQEQINGAIAYILKHAS